MSNATELLRRALEHLDLAYKHGKDLDKDIRAFLAAEPEAEPVTDNLLVKMFEALEAGLSIRPNSVFHDLIEKHLSDSKTYHIGWVNKERNLLSWDKVYEDMEPLYTRHEPARKPMTEREIMDLAKSFGFDDISTIDFAIGVRYAEKHHGIGEHDE